MTIRKLQRAHDALRPFKITPGFCDYAEGSVLVEMGSTRVLCNVSVQDSVVNRSCSTFNKCRDTCNAV